MQACEVRKAGGAGLAVTFVTLVKRATVVPANFPKPLKLNQGAEALASDLDGSLSTKFLCFPEPRSLPW